MITVYGKSYIHQPALPSIINEETQATTTEPMQKIDKPQHQKPLWVKN